MGLGGGLVMVLFFSIWSRVFGRRYLGQIQGAAQAATVLASAIGPWLLARSVELTGSYAGMFRLLAELPVSSTERASSHGGAHGQLRGNVQVARGRDRRRRGGGRDRQGAIPRRRFTVAATCGHTVDC